MIRARTRGSRAQVSEGQRLQSAALSARPSWSAARRSWRGAGSSSRRWSSARCSNRSRPAERRCAPATSRSRRASRSNGCEASNRAAGRPGRLRRCLRPKTPLRRGRSRLPAPAPPAVRLHARGRCARRRGPRLGQRQRGSVPRYRPSRPGAERRSAPPPTASSASPARSATMTGS